ncbi:PQQ-binding-like beta-propeller repeat protein [Candidatus Zixiibacteriota bacterium]
MIRITATRAVFALSLTVLPLPSSHPPAAGVVVSESYGMEQSAGEQIWTREVDSRTESLQIVGNDTVVRLGNRSIEAYAIETGDLTWSAARDGAGSVMVSEVDGTPYIVLLHRFDRPLPTSGQSEGTSWRVSVYRDDAEHPVWVSDPQEGDAIGCWPLPGHGQIIVLVRNDREHGTLSAVNLVNGTFLWDVEYGELDAVPHGGMAERERYFTTAGDQLFRVDRRERTVSLAAHDMTDGTLQWVGYLRGEGPELHLRALDGGLYVSGAMFTSIDPASGSVLWQISDPWVPIDLQMPWMLVRDPDGTRLQLIHVNSGEERWRSTPRMPASPVSTTCWFPEGLLAGNERGATSLFGVADARSISSERTRYQAPGRSGVESIFALPDGLLFVRCGPRGNLVLRTDTTGGTRWQTELSLPGPAVENSDGVPVPCSFSAPVGIGSGGTGGSLWIVGTTGRAMVVTRVDLQAGQERETHSLLASTPIFAVSEVHAVLMFIAEDGRLAAASF